MKYFLSLGSNLGDKAQNLKKAVSLLREEGVKIIKVSSLYETQPVEMPSQPWFFNQVIEVEMNHPPLPFLRLIKRVEKRMGRKRNYPRSPRIIDIDILLAQGTVFRSDELTIPHPRMVSRNFVLIPFKEISPAAVHPILKQKIEHLCDVSPDRSKVIKIDPEIEKYHKKKHVQ
ncbi:MAG: 2-amino-4-hydroxy-6-hydroxymethyldihydropteridine diphosphokinase [Candidatus Aminicenantes bacterium]